jgi:hypothetical protein
MLEPEHTKWDIFDHMSAIVSAIIWKAEVEKQVVSNTEVKLLETLESSLIAHTSFSSSLYTKV